MAVGSQAATFTNMPRLTDVWLAGLLQRQSGKAGEDRELDIVSGK